MQVLGWLLILSPQSLVKPPGSCCQQISSHMDSSTCFACGVSEESVHSLLGMIHFQILVISKKRNNKERKSDSFIKVNLDTQIIIIIIDLNLEWITSISLCIWAGMESGNHILHVTITFSPQNYGDLP